MSDEYIKGMEELLSTPIPSKAKEKRELISGLNSMLNHIIIKSTTLARTSLFLPSSNDRKICPVKQEHMDRLRSRISEVEKTLPKPKMKDYINE